MNSTDYSTNFVNKTFINQPQLPKQVKPNKVNQTRKQGSEKLSFIKTKNAKFAPKNQGSVQNKNPQSALPVQPKASPEEFCLINFKKTKNNTYCVISGLFGQQKTLWSICGGQISPGSTNGRRKTRYTQRMVIKKAIEKLLGLGFKYLVIHVTGPMISKRFIFKNFYKRFKIVLLKDLTGVPHNGCRAPSVRRI